MDVTNPMTGPSEMPRISVIIATRNRAESLRLTLESLASANRDGIQAQVIVVNNAGTDNTQEVAESFRGRLPVRYLYEETIGAFGKCHALNRALNSSDLGEIIVILDDDMTPRLDWFQAIIGACKRYPDKDMFAGHVDIIWPDCPVPQWAISRELSGPIYSSPSYRSDSSLKEGRWFSGNHFWFRSRVLKAKPEFKDLWLSEADFQLDLFELGYRGVACSDVAAGHRIQPVLLREDIVLARSRKIGVCSAQLRLTPYRRFVKQARLLHEHPLMGRVFCLLNHFRWRLYYALSFLRLTETSRFEYRVLAEERASTYLELFRVANRIDDYSIWRARRRKQREKSLAARHS
jgi:glycosyltransferase involved in cell wall biosynthesis